MRHSTPAALPWRHGHALARIAGCWRRDRRASADFPDRSRRRLFKLGAGLLDKAFGDPLVQLSGLGSALAKVPRPQGERSLPTTIFFAGASGAVGKRLTPLLVSQGYRVFGM